MHMVMGCPLVVGETEKKKQISVKTKSRIGFLYPVLLRTWEVIMAAWCEIEYFIEGNGLRERDR